MFGSYEPDNLLLHDVCSSCNNSFSKLEQMLGRDTPEAIQRIIHGLKPFTAANQLENRRLTYFVDRPGPWCGARVYLAGDHELYPVFLPQAAFQFSEEAPWHWILEEEISSEAVARYLGPRYRVKVTGDSDEQIERVRGKLEALGVIFKDTGPLEVPTGDDGKLELGIQSIVDDVILRAIAKIAFNYLAYVAGAEFVLHEDFNAIRSYVVAGEQPARWLPVAILTKKILVGDTSRWRKTIGHILTLSWSEDNSSPVAQVSFFNGLTYRVTLTWNYHGIWIPLVRGHLFEHQTQRILSITGYRPLPS